MDVKTLPFIVLLLLLVFDIEASWTSAAHRPPRVRLVNGWSACSGRVEAFVSGQWGTVYDHTWTLAGAQVVCRQLGCGTALTPRYNAYFGQAVANVSINSINCRGQELSVQQCHIRLSGSSNHAEDAGVVCEGAAPLGPSVNAVVKGTVLAVVGTKMCWTDALLYCRKFYGDLLSIRSEEEQRTAVDVLRNASLALSTTISNFTLTGDVWLGLRRYIRDSTWFWMSDESVAYTHWDKGPIWQNTSPCGGMRTHGNFTWSDVPCYDRLYFICMMDRKNLKKVEFYSSATKKN